MDRYKGWTIYWQLRPTEEDGGFHDWDTAIDASAPMPSATILDFTALLSGTVPLEESYMILLELVGSFLGALESIDKKKSDRIMQSLQTRIDVMTPQLDNLSIYFVERLKGRKHQDAIETTNRLEELFQQYSL